MPEEQGETRLGRWRQKVFANMGARVLALGSLALATLIVARTGGPSAVGVYALLRVLPGLVGVLVSAGLPGAVAYFLAGGARDDRRLTWTIVSMAVLGGVVGTALWAIGSPFLVRAFFRKPLGRTRGVRGAHGLVAAVGRNLEVLFPGSR